MPSLDCTVTRITCNFPCKTFYLGNKSTLVSGTEQICSTQALELCCMKQEVICDLFIQLRSAVLQQSVGPVLEGSGLNGNSLGTAISVAQSSGLPLKLVP